MPERKGARYGITVRHRGSTGAEHHQRTHASEMYDRMFAAGPSSSFSGVAEASAANSAYTAQMLRHGWQQDGGGTAAGVREPRKPKPKTPSFTANL